MQEAVVTAEYDQVRDVLGHGWQVVHHSEREPDGQGISIASRWPIRAVHEVDLHLGPRPARFACSALVATSDAGTVGRLVFVNHLPDWQLTHEAERERQAVAVARFVEKIVAGRTGARRGGRRHGRRARCDQYPVLDRPAVAGRIQRLLSRRVGCLRAAEAGHTFTPENRLTVTAEVGDWALELGRRIDYILVRCTDHGPTLDVRTCRRLFDEPVDGIWASDHFGMTAELSVTMADGRMVP